MVNLDEGVKHKFETEQVFYWLRKTADDVISMIYLFNFHKNNNRYPTKIKISCVGEFLKKENSFNGELNNHLQLLTQLNEISNGFKHSIINAQVHSHRGWKEPVVFAFSLLHNDLNNQAKFHSVKLRSLLLSYSDFLEDVRVILKRFVTGPNHIE
jgi:hypothetical protein